MSSLFDTPIRMAREMRQRYFSDDCSPMSAFAGIFRDYHIELQYESHGDSLRREGETYIITLPRNTSPERDVYTIAHEIGHIVLGHTLDAAGMLVRSRDLSPEERQANVFAAELLMHREQFRKVCSDCGNNVYDVAFRFGVSPAAAGVSMAILGVA